MYLHTLRRRLKPNGSGTWKKNANSNVTWNVAATRTEIHQHVANAPAVPSVTEDAHRPDPPVVALPHVTVAADAPYLAALTDAADAPNQEASTDNAGVPIVTEDTGHEQEQDHATDTTINVRTIDTARIINQWKKTC